MPTTITISDLEASTFLTENFPQELDRLERSAVEDYRLAAICQALSNAYGENWRYIRTAGVYTVQEPAHLAGTYTLEELEKRLGVYVDPDYMPS